MLKLLLTVLGLSLFAGIVTFVRWLAGSWLAFAGWCYVAGLLLTFAVSVFGLWVQRKGHQSPVDDLVAAIRQGVQEDQGSVKRARIQAGNVLMAVSLCIAWPVYLIVFIFVFIVALNSKGGGSVATRSQALIALYPFPTVLSLVSLLVALSMAALFESGLASLETARTIQTGIIIVMLSWGAGLLIGPWQLAEQLRQTQGNTYIRFVVIALSMVGAFIISLNAIDQSSGWLSFQALFSTGREMLSFSDVLDRDALTMSGALRAGAGFLTYAIALRGGWEFSKFERTSEDLVMLSIRLTAAGRPARGLQYLVKIENVDYAYLGARTYVLLGLGDFTGALAAASQASELAQAGGKYYANPHQECLTIAALVSTPEIQMKLFSNWLSIGADDAELCVSLGAMMPHNDPEQLRQFLGEHSTPEEYPLSHARMLWVGDEDDEIAAIAMLEQMSPPHGLGGVVWIAIQLRHHGLYFHESEDSAAVYRDAMANLVPELPNRIIEMDSAAHRLQAFGELLSLHVWLTRMSPASADVLLPHVSALEQTLMNEPLTKRLVQVEKVAQRKRSHLLKQMQT